MRSHTVVTIGLLGVLLVGAFLWERDFAVHSRPVEAQVVHTVPADSDGLHAYSFEYADPISGEERRDRITAKPWVIIAEGYFEAGDDLRLRRDTRNPEEVKFDRWYMLYRYTLMVLLIVVLIPLVMGARKLCGRG